MRARNYLFAIFGPMALAVVMSLAVGVFDLTDIAPFIPVVAILGPIAGCVFVYRMWSSINDGQTRPSPVAALLGLMIPVFGIFWAYRVWAGWPRAYARYAARTGKDVSAPARGAFTVMVTLAWVAPLLAVAAPMFLETREDVGILLVLLAAIALLTLLALFVNAVKTVCAGVNALRGHS